MEPKFQFTNDEMLEIIKLVNRLNTGKPAETVAIIDLLLMGGQS